MVVIVTSSKLGYNHNEPLAVGLQVPPKNRVKSPNVLMVVSQDGPVRCYK